MIIRVFFAVADLVVLCCIPVGRLTQLLQLVEWVYIQWVCRNVNPPQHPQLCQTLQPSLLEPQSLRTMDTVYSRLSLKWPLREFVCVSRLCSSVKMTAICSFLYANRFVWLRARRLCHFSENWSRILWAVGGPEEAQGLSDSMTRSLFDLESLTVISVWPVSSWQRSLKWTRRTTGRKTERRAWMGIGGRKRGSHTSEIFTEGKQTKQGVLRRPCSHSSYGFPTLCVFGYANVFLSACIKELYKY